MCGRRWRTPDWGGSPRVACQRGRHCRTRNSRDTKYTEEGWSLQQLSKVGTHADTRISNTEELIDETTNSNEDDTNEPSTESACGNGGVIMVIDGSTYFGVRRVLYQRVTEGSVRIQHGTPTITIRAASTLSSS